MAPTSRKSAPAIAHGVVRIPKALERYLGDMEDHLLAAAALEEMKAKGKTKGKSLGAVARKLGLAGEL